MRSNLLEFTDKGIYCSIGKFYIDPWHPVDKAIITHAHSDHARRGSKYYLCHHFTKPLLKTRLGEDIVVESVNYLETVFINNVKVSFHPAGHIVGSAQIRLEYNGDIWVVSGDYKTEDDNVSTPFEVVKCNTFITESTFGMPVYQWQPQEKIFNEINSWWASNRGFKSSVIFAYSLGKAQRIIKNVDPTIGPIYVHGAIASMNDAMAPFINLTPTYKAAYQGKEEFFKSLIIAPPSALNSPWMKRFFPFSTAYASGWMALRGAKRRGAVDRGFTLSDHADWPSLNKVVAETGAETIYVTHGYKSAFSRWLRENGKKAYEVETLFEGEVAESLENLEGNY